MGPASGDGVVGGRTSEHWFTAVNHLSQDTTWLHAPARLYATDGVLLFAGLLLLSWWWARRARDLRRVSAALWAPVGALVAIGVNQVLAAAVAEPRPYAVLAHPLVLVARSTDYSFPSDHAVMAGAVAAGVLVADRALGLLATGLALLMAFVRVYVGAHFPLDVAVGLLVGAGLALTSYAVAAPLVRRSVRGLAGTRMRVLLTAPTPEAER